MIAMPNRVRVVMVVSALALAVSLLTLALLAKPAQAQAETITDNDRSTFDGSFISCTGEFVFIEGTMHTVAHTTIDENGGFHTTFHLNTQGRGVSDSGAKYVFHNVFNQHLVFTDASNATLTQTIKLIRQGSATPTDDATLKFLIHVTINANGEVTADVSKFEAECK